MKTTAQCVKDLARFFDGQGKLDKPIKTDARRETLMRGGIKPKRRGGPLYVGQHEVHARDFTPRQPAPVQVDVEDVAPKRRRKTKTKDNEVRA